MRRVQFFILLASVLLGLGLFTPCLTVTPAAGEWTGVLKIFKPDFATPRPISIVSGIKQLFHYGHFFIGLIILVFSVLFPLGKLGVLWTAAWDVTRQIPSERLLGVVEKVGKYSMLDILVIALVIVAIKGLPGGSKVTVGIGLYCFALAVLISLVLPMMVRRASKGSQDSGQSNAETQQRK